MTQTQMRYHADKNKAAQLLARLRDFLEKGKQFGEINTKESLEKLEKAEQKIQQKKAKFGFHGCF